MAKTQMISMRMQWVIRLLEFLIILGVVFFCVRSVIGFLAPQSLWSPSAQHSEISDIRSSRRENISFDFAIDPFHREKIVPVETKVGQDAPETTLSLKLFGRRAGPEGSAIVETPDRIQSVFNIGDEIIDGVILKAVNPDYIVLSRRGTLERLTFERDGPRLLAARQDDTEIKLSLNTDAKPSGSNVFGNQRPSVSHMSPQDLISALSFTRVMNSGKSGGVKGFEITSKSDKIKLETFGLRSGDIITAIGGQDLTQGRPDIGTLIAKLSATNSVRLNVLRGDANLVLNVGRP